MPTNATWLTVAVDILVLWYKYIAPPLSNTFFAVHFYNFNTIIMMIQVDSSNEIE